MASDRTAGGSRKDARAPRAPRIVRLVLVSGLTDVQAGILNGQIVVALGPTPEATGRAVARALRSVARPDFPARN